MKFDHAVKYDGKWYEPFEEIAEVESSTSVSSNLEYTKTDINRMSTADLRSLAVKSGIDDAFDISGADLKKLLIEKFGL